MSRAAGSADAAAAGAEPSEAAAACALDHLVVAARTLDEGVAWCAATLGVTPGPGGRHPLMGTHNRLLAIGSERFPQAYLEIIAIDPHAPEPGRARWFDLDRPALQAALARGARLVHWVARTAALDAAVGRLARLGLDAGRVLAASRPTPEGELRWRIAVRDDGARLCGGTLPLLIAWGERHPAATLPPSGVTLASIALHGGGSAGDGARALGFACDAPADGGRFAVMLDSPRGAVRLAITD